MRVLSNIESSHKKSPQPAAANLWIGFSLSENVHIHILLKSLFRFFQIKLGYLSQLVTQVVSVGYSTNRVGNSSWKDRP